MLSLKKRQKRDKFISIEELRTGDVILFSEKTGAFTSVKTCRWMTYSFAAFVVQVHPSPDIAQCGKVQLCGHFSSDTENTTVTIQQLDLHLTKYRYDGIFVRRLSHPLSPPQCAAVQRFADEACGADAYASGSLGIPQTPAAPASSKHGAGGASAHHSGDEEVLVLMAQAQREGLKKLSCAPAAERFLTSRLIANMLAAGSQVACDSGHTYLAATNDDRVLEHMQQIAPVELARIRGAALMQSQQPAAQPLL